MSKYTTRLCKKSLRGFTLIELLVTISIIGILASLMLPALAVARQTAKTTSCLSNLRNMEVAHWIYMTDHDDHLVDVGLGGFGHDPGASWVNTLQEYYGGKLLRRSPVDQSPYWGSPTPSGETRQTSYGINNFLVPTPGAGVDHPITSLAHVHNPAATVHFVYMSEDHPTYATADHPHANLWDDLGIPEVVPALAAEQLQLAAHGGPKANWESITNYGFLDGHAETLRFDSVYSKEGLWNCFDPQQAR